MNRWEARRYIAWLAIDMAIGAPMMLAAVVFDRPRLGARAWKRIYRRISSVEA